MARKIFVALLVPFIVLGIMACPGAILDPILISFDTNGAVVGAVVTFTSRIHGDAYMWEFGDGTTGNGKIYWVNRSSTPSIKRANLDGSSVEEDIAGLNDPHDLDLF